jgi:hypothetical protein
MKEKQSRSHTRSLNINSKQIEMGEKKETNVGGERKQPDLREKE